MVCDRPRGTVHDAMACRGVHFAIDDDQAARLRAAEGDEELLEIVGEIEEAWESAYETDKSWDAIHRTLTDGSLSGDPGGLLGKAVFGGDVLNEEDDYFVVLLTPDEVREVATALAGVTEDWMRERYWSLPFTDYQGEKSDEDWAYTWGGFEGLPPYFAEAAARGRWVVFTVDQ